MAVEAARPRTLRLYGDQTLRRACRPVAPDEPGLHELVADMTAIMDRHGGVGLAAPQVGVPLRLFLARPPGRPRTGTLVFINPERLHATVRTEPFDEGCLSFPGVYRIIVRPAAVTVAYRDPDGGTHRLEANGLLARIIQHEMDHLDGVLLVDHLGWATRWGVQIRMAWQRLWTRREA